MVEKLITLAKEGSIHSRRQVAKIIRDKSVVHKLFTEIAETFRETSGGYVRITRIGSRLGDNAELVQLELLQSPKPTKSGESKRAEAAEGDDETENEVIETEGQSAEEDQESETGDAAGESDEETEDTSGDTSDGKKELSEAVSESKNAVSEGENVSATESAVKLPAKPLSKRKKTSPKSTQGDK
jgi:large subunit ribosomal protein L17